MAKGVQKGQGAVRTGLDAEVQREEKARGLPFAGRDRL